MKRKLIATVLVTVLLLVSSISVFAADQMITSPGTTNIDITATVESTFEIDMPARVAVNNNSTTTFDITASGNIAGTETLSIVGPTSVQFVQDGKDSVTATVSQPKTTWSSVELSADGGTTTTVTVTVGELSAGEWTALAQYVVKLEAEDY